MLAVVEWPTKEGLNSSLINSVTDKTCVSRKKMQIEVFKSVFCLSQNYRVVLTIPIPLRALN